MGFGKIKRAIGGVVGALPGGKSQVGQLIYGQGAGLPIIKSGMESIQRSAAASQATIEQKNTQIAEEQRQKAIAEQSVRAQEELARRKTIFGGDVIDQAQQRKTLLGL
jgi:hypothetical protein